MTSPPTIHLQLRTFAECSDEAELSGACAGLGIGGSATDSATKQVATYILTKKDQIGIREIELLNTLEEKIKLWDGDDKNASRIHTLILGMQTEASTTSLNDEHEFIEKVDGHYWNSIKKEKSEGGGFIHIFKLRNEYNRAFEGTNPRQINENRKRKEEEIFPAVEKFPENLTHYWDLSRTKSEIVDKEAQRWIEQSISEWNMLFDEYSAEGMDERVIDLIGILFMGSDTKAIYQKLVELNGGKTASADPEGFRKGIHHLKDESISQYISFQRQVGRNLDEELELEKAKIRIFRELGIIIEHEGEEYILKLPDSIAFKHRWEQLKTKYPGLPDLSIFVSDENSASDLRFVMSYLEHDFHLSMGKEFIHDWMAHIIPGLDLILTDFLKNEKQYKTYQEKFRESIQEELKSIEYAFNDLENGKDIGVDKKELEMILKMKSVLVDSGTPGIGNAEANLREGIVFPFYRLLESNQHWKNYFLKNYPGEDISTQGMARWLAVYLKVIDNYRSSSRTA